MVNIPPPMTQDEINKFFPPTRVAPIKVKTYEIGLTLGGTVSAGAYTAGVLDYLVEALDAWTRAKEDGDLEAPQHNAVISTISGTSGGAICGAMLTRVAGWQFPRGAVNGNPFYDTWVNRVTLAGLLAPKEPGVTGFAALFNTSAFADLAKAVTTETGAPLGSGPSSPRARSYLADPLRLSMMVGNVTGLPYRIQFRGQSGLGHDLSAHADYMSFALTVPGGVTNTPGIRPDEIALASPSPTNWDLVAAAALSTCAFPAAFRSRPLSRPLPTLGYRVAVVPGDKPGTAELAQLLPRWQDMGEDGKTPNMFRTVNVDGGTFNNEPLDHVRQALAGYAGRNPRGGDMADRGVVLIDPFSDPEAITLFDPPGLLGLIGPLIGAMISQARFKPEDLALAGDFDTYSRFLVAPYGPGADGIAKSGSTVIASGNLGGFIGFVDRRFLDYDFKLGRRNAYDFLTKEFLLPSTNPIFTGTWTADQLSAHMSTDKSPITGKVETFLPIIPLMKFLRDNPPPIPVAADWPKLAAAPAALPSQIEARLNAIYEALKSSATWWPSGMGGMAAGAAWSLFLRGTLRDAFVGKITVALKEQKLL